MRPATRRTTLAIAWSALIWMPSLATPAESISADPDPTSRLSTWEMPGIVVVGQAPVSPYRDDELIGDYAQPRWSAQRLFPGTRIYVIPRGEIDLEQWFRFETPRDGPTERTTQTEVEFGLSHRLQLDLYLIERYKTNGPTFMDNAIEMRYALADWGRIWGNPALYLEFVTQEQAPNKVEGKLLLGDSLRQGWRWGSNFSLEQETGGTAKTEVEWTLSFGRTVIDRQLSVGLEGLFYWTNEKGDRAHYTRDFQIGPSLQYRPLKQLHIDFSPLVGLGSDSKRADIFVIFGWEF